MFPSLFSTLECGDETENVVQAKEESSLIVITPEPPSVDDVVQENQMLRAHLAELNRHVLMLSDDSHLRERLADLEKRLELTECLRSKAEVLLHTKLEEVRNLNALIDRQVRNCRKNKY